MSSSGWKLLAAVAALSLFSVTTASAQLCGDADLSGAVTVTDGVQTLRAAATLSSSCTAAACDVDGSGSITVTDGVNVLRKAAGIAITENCPGSSVDAQVESLLRSTLPVFGNLTKLGAPAQARAAETFQCDNVGGSFTIDDQTGELEFSNCELGGFLYDGFFAGDADTLDFDITFTDLSTGGSETLSGSLSQRVSGQNFVVSGFFDLESSFGSFSVDFNELVVDANGFFVGGSLEFSVDDGFSDVESIRLTFDTSNFALVEVFLVDGEVLPFSYDVSSGELTPISN
jgi:hypothetical protein